MIRSDGLQAGDQQKLDTIGATIVNVQEYLRAQGDKGVLDQADVERAREQAAALERLFSRGEAADERSQAFYASIEKLLGSIAATNAATADNTVPKQPSATPLLSSEQP